MPRSFEIFSITLKRSKRFKSIKQSLHYLAHPSTTKLLFQKNFFYLHCICAIGLQFFVATTPESFPLIAVIWMLFWIFLVFLEVLFQSCHSNFHFASVFLPNITFLGNSKCLGRQFFWGWQSFSLQLALELRVPYYGRWFAVPISVLCDSLDLN